MPNTKSAKKAARQSIKKKQHNQMWKKRIRSVAKTLNDLLQTKSQSADILNKELSALQKVLDRAAKEKVIHKNKAARLKSRYAKRITAQSTNTQAKQSGRTGTKRSVSKSSS